MRTLSSRVRRLEGGRLGIAAADHEPMFYLVSPRPRGDGGEPKGIPQRVALEAAAEVHRDEHGRVTGYRDADGRRMLVFPL